MPSPLCEMRASSSAFAARATTWPTAAKQTCSASGHASPSDEDEETGTVDAREWSDPCVNTGHSAFQQSWSRSWWHGQETAQITCPANRVRVIAVNDSAAERGRAGAHVSWANTADRPRRTLPARRAFM